MESVTPELLRRTRVSAGLSALLIAHWLFGNLYEEVVTAPQALLDPEPGALIGAFALGSPFWYYGPTLPAAVALVWILALRLRRGDRPGGFGAAGAGRPATWSLRAAVAVTLAAVAKVTLIVLVNPTFRDPNVSAEQVRATTVAWLWGNGLVVVALATALACLLWWRRVPARMDHPIGDPFRADPIAAPPGGR